MDRRTRPTRPRRICIAVVLPLVISFGIWPGCTPEKRYRVLSFFFDGVPDPSLAAAQAHGAGVRGRGPGGEPMIVFSHKPFAEEKCEACHAGGVNALFRPLPQSVSATTCLKCHKDATRQYVVMHGPVANVECLWCHAPHEANFKPLLKMKSPDVCLQCHTPELLSSEPIEHTMTGADC